VHTTGCQPGFLARDRDAGLIVELGLRSGFDFRRHDPTDPYQRLWLRICLERMRQQRYTQALAAKSESVIAFMLHRIAVVSASQPITETSLEQARELIQSRIRLLLPWVGDENVQAERDKLRQAWVDTYGDPNDPAVQAKIAEVVAYLQG
jgi:hypothetical protein